jgi:hypothetical protein
MGGKKILGPGIVAFLALTILTSPTVYASDLQDAIEANDVVRVKTLLASGANPNE